MRKIPDTISEEELIKIVTSKKIKRHHKLSFLLGFYQSMRVSEVVKLRAEYIKTNQHIIQIKQAKGSKDRDIPIIKPIKMKPLTMVYALNHLPIGCGVRALEIAIKNYGKKILNKDIHFHTLRHSGATWLLNKKKWDIRKVQQFLGHEDIKTTQIYLHVGSQDLVDMEWNDE
jgi:site-specific recombinase XerD